MVENVETLMTVSMTVSSTGTLISLHSVSSHFDNNRLYTAIDTRVRALSLD